MGRIVRRGRFVEEDVGSTERKVQKHKFISRVNKICLVKDLLDAF